MTDYPNQCQRVSRREFLDYVRAKKVKEMRDRILSDPDFASDERTLAALARMLEEVVSE